jgi:hypothetical protein
MAAEHPAGALRQSLQLSGVKSAGAPGNYVVNLSHQFEMSALVMILARQWAESNWPDPLCLDVRPHLLNISRARAWLLPVRGQKFGHGLLIERNGLYYPFLASLGQCLVSRVTGQIPFWADLR